MGSFDCSPKKHPEYTSYRLVVNICEDEHGRVWSDHDFLSEEDYAVASATRNGGVEQMAHALLVEALRREAFVDFLVKFTHDMELFQAIQKDEKRRAEIVGEIEKVVTRVVTQILPKALPGLVQDILEMMLRIGTDQPQKE